MILQSNFLRTIMNRRKCLKVKIGDSMQFSLKKTRKRIMAIIKVNEVRSKKKVSANTKLSFYFVKFKNIYMGTQVPLSDSGRFTKIKTQFKNKQ